MSTKAYDKIHSLVITRKCLKYTTVVTRKYLQLVSYVLASTKVHERNCSRAHTTQQQSIASSVFLVSHESNTWVISKIFQVTKDYTHFFVNLDVYCTVFDFKMHIMHIE